MASIIYRGFYFQVYEKSCNITAELLFDASISGL